MATMILEHLINYYGKKKSKYKFQFKNASRIAVLDIFIFHKCAFHREFINHIFHMSLTL